MISLGIECTAHTFGVGIVDSDGKILANERDMYRPALGKGIIPTEAGEHHRKVSKQLFERALEKAGIKIEDVDVIAYSAGPGLPPALLAGFEFAESISKKYKKKLMPVNHPVAHLEIGKLTTNTKDPVYVYLSGGNTQIIAFAEGRYRIFGETEDITIGNCFDVFAREVGLPMPGGPEIEKIAKHGKYIELPYVVKGMDLSFSGILTKSRRLYEGGARKEDLAFSMQEVCFSMLAEVTERAVAHMDKKEVLLVGGVVANKRLQEIMGRMSEDRGAKMYVVPEEYSGDQGAMIAWVGILAYKSGWKDGVISKEKIDGKWRIDEVEITWKE
ncbi:MAG: N(6)-L-threonylcarbamoyladenine synthase Kae1 [Candidatus Aenigmarchaeota archaeon]|nr:N(6)-L-threonylcarbamoyladenine synthase Kae1 [Candidatus Aenigmarchaeota archaeon]